MRNLSGVRLDTGSRRNMSKIIKKLDGSSDIRGYKDVKIFLSGGLDENSFKSIKDADAFGVELFQMPKQLIMLSTLLEIDGKPFTKRSKLSGKNCS